MAAHARATLDGVEPLVAMTSPARQEIAATMAPQLMQTDWMVALALARKVGVVRAATPTSLATMTMTAVAMAQRKIRIPLMAASASASSDGKVTAVMLR